MKTYFKILGIAFLLLITACNSEEKIVFVQGEEPGGTTIETDVTLKEKANFNIGAAVKMNLLLDDTEYAEAFKANFDQLTAEFEMKMDAIWASENNYNWDAADYLVNFAEDNNMEIHGHALVWYRTFPDWFVNQNNDSIAFESKIKTYITDVVGRYKGKIKSWDVTNEVFADGGGIRDEAVIAPLFNDPIAFYERCFQYAKDADADAKLFYNDFSVVIDAGKREAIKNMATRFKADGFPIDGIGAQFHYGKDTSLTRIEEGFADIASTGLLIHISELDIKMNVNQTNDFSLYSGFASQQAAIYEAIVAMYETLPESQKFGISTWGISDNYSWLKETWHPTESPLLFDADLNKKIAFQGFLDGLN